MGKSLNIILLTIDDLRADHLGFMGYEKKVSPNLDKLAKESIVFSQAFSVGPMTPHSFPAILTSTYTLDYQGPKKIERPRVLLSEVLKKGGYTTAVFSANPYLYFGYDKGWDYLEDIKDDVFSEEVLLQKKRKGIRIKYLLESIGTFISNFLPELVFRIRYLLYKLDIWKLEDKVKAASINECLKDFISSVKEEKKPFFAWVHYMDVHYPFLPYDSRFKERKLTFSELVGRNLSTFLSKEYFFKEPIKRFGEKYIKEAVKLYDDGIKYIDEEIGKLIDFLKKENVYQNTVIVLTADHGEEFLEHGGTAHNNKLYNELLQVPLLIKIPEEKSREINNKVSLIDLAPTICKIAGIEPDSYFKGKNLFEEKEEIIFHQTGKNPQETGVQGWLEIKDINQSTVACQTNQWKCIWDHSNDKKELYNLVQDPKEQNESGKEEPKILSQMIEKIKEFERKNQPLENL